MVSSRAPRRCAWPGDGVQAPKARILEEAIAYVGTLRSTVAKLEAHSGVVEGAGRRTAADGGGAVAAVEVLAVEKASCFAARLPAARRQGTLTRVLEVFRRHGVPVLAATVTLLKNVDLSRLENRCCPGFPTGNASPGQKGWV